MSSSIHSLLFWMYRKKQLGGLLRGLIQKCGKKVIMFHSFLPSIGSKDMAYPIAVEKVSQSWLNWRKCWGFSISNLIGSLEAYSNCSLNRLFISLGELHPLLAGVVINQAILPEWFRYTLGYLELDFVVFGKEIPNKGVLVVKDVSSTRLVRIGGQEILWIPADSLHFVPVIFPSPVDSPSVLLFEPFDKENLPPSTVCQGRGLNPSLWRDVQMFCHRTTQKCRLQQTEALKLNEIY